MSFVCCVAAGPLCPAASLNELNLFAPLTILHIAINNNKQPTAINRAVITVLAIGGADVANDIKPVISSGNSSIPFKN